jgi:hypothetical protein
MEMREFGRTGMQLSVLGFGCGAVGGQITDGCSIIPGRPASASSASACSPAGRCRGRPTVIRLRVRRPSRSARP